MDWSGYDFTSDWFSNHLPVWNAKRRACAACYNDLLRADAELITVPYEPSWSRAVYHLYVIQVEGRDAVQQLLGAVGIGTGIHYPIPLHLQNAYSSLGYKPRAFPVAEEAAKRILSLPMDPSLTREQQLQVVQALRTISASVSELVVAGEIR